MLNAKLFLRKYAWLLAVVFTSVLYFVIYAFDVYFFSSNADFAIISEVSRKMSLGSTLYVDTIDQKGPLLYMWWSVRWLFCSSYRMFYTWTCVSEWIIRTISLYMIAKLFHEEERDDFAWLGCAMLLLIDNGRAAEIEPYITPFAVYGAIVVRREMRKEKVPWWSYAIIGIGAGIGLCMKWPVCAMLVVVLAYGLSQTVMKNVAKGFVIAMASALVLCATVWFVAGSHVSFPGMWKEYIQSSSFGYVIYLFETGTLSPFMFFHMICIGFILLICVVCTVKVMHKSYVYITVVLANIFLFMISLVVGYYDMFALMPILFGFVDMSGKASFASICKHFPRVKVVQTIPFVIAFWTLPIIGSVSFACISTFIESQDTYILTVDKIIGHDMSVMPEYFGNLDTYFKLNRTSPYAQPTKNNVSTSARDVVSDFKSGKWRYLLGFYLDGVDERGRLLKEHDIIHVYNHDWEILAISNNRNEFLARLDESQEAVNMCFADVYETPMTKSDNID